MRNLPSSIQLVALGGVVVFSAAAASCHGSSGAEAAGGSVSTGPGMTTTGVGTGGVVPTAPACTPAATPGGAVQQPTLLYKLANRYQEGWLASPAVVDIDGDGKNEIIVAREGLVVVWNSDGSPKWRFDTLQDRIWASPVVANFVGDAKLGIAVAARTQIFMLDATGKVVSGFPVSWQNELRSLAAADVDGDGKLELVAAPGMSSPPT